MIKLSIIPLLLFVFACSSPSGRKSKEVSEIDNVDFKREKPVKFQKSTDYYSLEDILEGDPNSLIEETVANLPVEKLDDIEDKASERKDSLGQLTSKCYQKNFESAFSKIEKLYDRYKNHPSYWTQVGSCYFKKGEVRKALLFYQKAIEVDKNYAPAFNNIGNIHLYNKEYEKALAAFQKARKINRFAKVPTYNLALMYLNFGVIDKSIQLFNSINNQKPGDPNIFNGLAVAYLFKGNVKKSMDLYSRIPKSYMRLPRFGINYAVTVYLSGNKEQARDIFSDVRRDDLGTWSAYYQKIAKVLEG